MAYIRLARVPEQSFFLLGMRGVGKSTWARQALPGALRLDLLDEALFTDLLADPSLFRQLLSGAGPGDWVVVDEVQRIPSLLNEAHRLIEERGVRFALLGSSARKLKTAGTNLLAGRALRKAMHPLTAAELGDDFRLDDALQYGAIALVWNAPDRREALSSYTQLYLREEIRAEAAVRNLSGFVRFLPVAALMHAQVVNAASIARDAAVARTTVNGYLEILEDTLLAVFLPAFEARLRVRERRRPKLYWADPGLVRAIKRQLGPVAAEERGALLEGWVLGLLRAHNEHQRIYDDIGYWSAAASAAEVDFVLTRDREHLAVEVKAAERYNTAMLKGLRALADLPGLVRRVLVYRGQRSFRTEDGIDVWSLDSLHEALRADQLWP
ncbi:MAG: ATP-binding protein [Acidimicrobiaceae bacterium]|nr:ATP-binding protein [Acidimicrobiaceae bacterium]MXZ99832.1 ATP-binding protein [Acidimicrobiaceae bacterium]MYE75014.1 ATP-binding protein [Acidimicrobiaceae bacterium]MYE97611.1 ATP-binding protein [Acidimicrobiaceae bacterium]MYH43432.1 ATP-binding protein [Acidimicrobiaceae bacterium]